MSTATTVSAPANGATSRAVSRIPVEDKGVDSYMFDTGRFEHMYRIAKVIAQSSMLPAHLRSKAGNHEETVANVFRVVNQAVRWGFDPFAIVDATYVVGQKLGYEGKLIAAVINARGGLHDSLSVIYNRAKGMDMAAVVYGSRSPIPESAWDHLEKYAETEDGKAQLELAKVGVKTIRLTVKESKTDNKMWTGNPAQKLFYTGSTMWARKHMPELMLGVHTEDDLERMTIQAEVVQPARISDGGTKSDALADMIDTRQTERTTEQPATVETAGTEQASDQGEPTAEKPEEQTLMQAVYAEVHAFAELEKLTAWYAELPARRKEFTDPQWGQIRNWYTEQTASLKSK